MTHRSATEQPRKTTKVHGENRAYSNNNILYPPYSYKKLIEYIQLLSCFYRYNIDIIKEFAATEQQPSSNRQPKKTHFA